MNRLKELRAKEKISQQKLADKLKVARSTIAMWETGGSQPDNNVLIELSELFNVSVDYLIGRDLPDRNVEPFYYNAAGVIHVPILGRIPAGMPLEAIEDIIGYEEAPAEWARGGKEFFALKIQGDSMYPKYENGDIVIFKRQETCENGEDCAVMVNGNDATFKRVYRNMNGIVLQPLNPSYSPKSYSNEEIENLPVRIIGVFWELRRGRKY